MKLKNFSPWVISFIVGTAVGFCFNTNSEQPPQQGGKDGARSQERRAIRDEGDKASIKALRARIGELEKRLAAESDDGDGADEEGERIAEQPNPERTGGWFGNGRSMRENIEELKKNDPERYAEISKRMESYRQQRLGRAQDKLDFLSAVDVSGMSEQARTTHSRLQDLIERREELEAQMHDENLEDDERGRLFAEMRETDGAIMRLNGEERINLIETAAKNLGLNGRDVKEMSETIQGILDATDNGGGWGRMGGQPPHRHGGGRR